MFKEYKYKRRKDEHSRTIFFEKIAVGLVSVSLLCAIYTSTVAADTVVTGVNEIIEESQVKDEVSIESEKNESLDGSNIEIVEEIADNIPSPVIAEGEVAVEMKVDRGTENVVSRNDTEVTTSEQNQIEVTETKEILNQTSYQTESGEQRQIIWAMELLLLQWNKAVVL